MMFGVTSFVSNSEGFTAQLKTCPQDFIVTEISLDRKLASITNDAFKPSKNINVIQEGCAKNVVPTQPVNGSHQVYTHSQSTSLDEAKNRMECSSNHEVQLENVLGNKTLNELKMFAAKELALLKRGRCASKSPNGQGGKDREASAIDANPCCHNILNLGLIYRKDARTVIHQSVRKIYPFLRTLNCKISEKDGLEIHISIEPMISEFQDLGIRLEVVLEFIRFVESRACEQTFTISDVASKNERTELHRLVAKHYGAFLESKTFGDGASGGRQSIVVRFRQKFKNHRKRGRGDHLETEDKPVYTGFILEKINKETLEAIHQLSRMLGVHTSDFSYAGVKDKKAVTTQHMAVKGVTTTRLLAAASKSLPRGLKVGNACPRIGPIKVGQLWGNHFEIVLRGVELRRDHPGRRGKSLKEQERLLECLIEKSIQCVEEKGFINYFGAQRFGTASLDPSEAITNISPADVGRAMLQGNYINAVKLILSPDNGPRADPSDKTNVAKCHYLATGCAKDALKLMPSHKTRECLVLKALNRHGTNSEGCIKALMNIPHSIRQMYVHAYSSLVWNHVASWRMDRYGHEVVAGDLVLTGESRSQVHAVTEDEIKMGIYSIIDIVLPLPGNNVMYPSHAAGAEFQKMLAEGGLGERNFRLPALKLNATGGYRKIIIRPKNLKWGSSVGVIGDDQDACRQVAVQQPSPGNHDPLGGHNNTLGSSPSHALCTSSTISEMDVGSTCPSNEWGHRSLTESKTRTLSTTELQSSCREKLLNLSFDLPSSCYATIFLRELMKM